MKVGIICRTNIIEEKKPFELCYIIDGQYIEIAEKLNIILIPIISSKDICELEKICDALIIPGCHANIHPKYYNELPDKSINYEVDDYYLDMKAIEIFSQNNKPILGICGGIQSINVFFGGSLYQKISNHRLTDGTKHKIIIENESFLSKVYNRKEIEVNSYHSQAIKKLAPGFKITAKSSDGVIEAIEKSNIIAVQWHPEVLYDLEFFENFFDIIKEKGK